MKSIQRPCLLVITLATLFGNVSSFTFIEGGRQQVHKPRWFALGGSRVQNTKLNIVLKSDSSSSADHVSTDSTDSSKKEDVVEMTVDLPPSGSGITAIMKLKPVLSVPSTFVEVRYSIPFELSVEPKNNLALCTKAGPGGEQVGDVLRYTSQWTLGLPMDDGGLTATANAFAGGLKWGCSMFDVMASKDWRQVVEALTTNTPQRTDEVVLIFERPL